MATCEYFGEKTIYKIILLVIFLVKNITKEYLENMKERKKIIS